MWLRPHPGLLSCALAGLHRYSRFADPSGYGRQQLGSRHPAHGGATGRACDQARQQVTRFGRPANPAGIDQRPHPFPFLAGHDRLDADKLTDHNNSARLLDAINVVTAAHQPGIGAGGHCRYWTRPVIGNVNSSGLRP